MKRIVVGYLLLCSKYINQCRSKFSSALGLTTSMSLDDDAVAYNTYASAAVDLSDAHVTRNGLLTVIRSVRDIDNDKRRKFLYSIPLPSSESQSSSPILVPPPVELHESIQIRIPSPTGEKIAIFRQEQPKTTSSSTSPKKQQVLEIWINGGHVLQRRILLPEKIHGKVMHDPGGFGSPSWNRNETFLIYSASRNNPETTSFFDDTDDKNDKEPKVRGGTNTLGLGKTEHWGEKYFEQPALLDLYCVSVETGRVGRVENVIGASPHSNTSLGGYSLGQPVFGPDDPESSLPKTIVYAAWDAGGGSEMPKRLGLVYCQQRPSQLYESPVDHLLQRLLTDTDEDTTSIGCDDEEPVLLTTSSRLARSPRFSPNADNGTCKLVYLSSQGFDTHMGCWALSLMDVVDGRVVPDSQRILVKPVWTPKESLVQQGELESLNFPGLFLLQLPEACFLSSDSLVTTTQWGSRQAIVRLSLSDGSLRVIDCGDDLSGSQAVLCTTLQGGMVVSRTAPNRPADLTWVATPKRIQSCETTLLLDTSACPIASTRYSAVSYSAAPFGFDCSVQVLSDPPLFDGVDKSLVVQSILLLPDKSKHPQPPVIVVPHGGPHSCLSMNYLASYAFLCGHGGYAILLVNYRGSTGFGQASIESLPTRIGEMDVQDVVAATKKLKESGLVDRDRIGICGGSHGGFLTGHCISQYPDLFKAAAMRNPVVNIASMVTTTDIPDWCYVEACGTYNWKEYRPPNKQDVEVMWDRSPIRYVANVKTPTLVALGLKDLRVPPSQGLEWYHTLRSKGVPTKLLLYPDDDHAIANVASEADHWVNIKRWFDEHL